MNTPKNETLILARYMLTEPVIALNIVTAIGWSTLNGILGALFLHAANNDVPGWAGILIITGATLFVCFFGYRIVHAYQRYAWIPMLIIFLIVLGEFAHSGQFSNLSMGTGRSEAGSALSYGCAVFGSAIGWAAYAADYTVYQPSTRSGKAVCLWTFTGSSLTFPAFIVSTSRESSKS